MSYNTTQTRTCTVPRQRAWLRVQPGWPDWGVSAFLLDTGSTDHHPSHSVRVSLNWGRWQTSHSGKNPIGLGLLQLSRLSFYFFYHFNSPRQSTVYPAPLLFSVDIFSFSSALVLTALLCRWAHSFHTSGIRLHTLMTPRCRCTTLPGIFPPASSLQNGKGRCFSCVAGLSGTKRRENHGEDPCLSICVSLGPSKATVKLKESPHIWPLDCPVGFTLWCASCYLSSFFKTELPLKASRKLCIFLKTKKKVKVNIFK